MNFRKTFDDDLYVCNLKNHNIKNQVIEFDKKDTEAKNLTGKVYVQNMDLFNVREVEKHVRENTDELIQMNRF
jgi:hypothetical protein